MTLIYATTNLITSTTLPSDNAVYRSSENSTYPVANLYNRRPSYPFMFTAKAGQWVKANLGTRQIASISAIFNHNFTNAATVQLHASGINGAWKLVDNYTYRLDDMYIKFGINEIWLRLSVSDAGNTSFPRIGDWFVAEHSVFANAHVNPGRGDGPMYAVADAQTPYEQDWEAAYSKSGTFNITLSSINDPSTIDDLQTFLDDVIMNNGGRFVWIPNDSLPNVYYVKVMNRRDFANRRVIGSENELRDWRLDFKILTSGITFIS